MAHPTNNNNNQPLPSMINSMMPPMANQASQPIQQENQYERSLANSQQGLADKIQAVRHLWESENQYANASPFTHQMPNYNQQQQQQQQSSSAFDPLSYNHMNTIFPHVATSGYVQFQ